MPVHGGRQQFYHVYHIHEIHGLSSNNSIFNNNVTFIKEIATKRKYSKFHLFESLIFIYFLVYIRVKCEGFCLFFFFLSSVVGCGECAYNGGSTRCHFCFLQCFLWSSFLPCRTHLSTYICLTFSQSVLLILYFTLTHLHRCNKKC